MRVLNNPKGWLGKNHIKRIVKQLQKTELHQEFIQRVKHKPKNNEQDKRLG